MEETKNLVSYIRTEISSEFCIKVGVKRLFSNAVTFFYSAEANKQRKGK